jgi:hypothetical protein
MMFTPLEPKAGPTGGAGFAWLPLTCSLMNTSTSFAIAIYFSETYDFERQMPIAVIFSYLNNN